MDPIKSAKPVLFSEVTAGNGRIGVITINRPKNLNALNTECYQLMNPKLLAWENNPEIVAIVIRSKNEKVFCAGGDVKGLVLGIREHGLNYAKDFFTEEYFCNGLIASYKKPVLALVQGFVFGGGMGLFMSASHRLAAQNTTWSMPETGIGLFPDVGSTHYLSQWPHDFGLFLGLTGVRWDLSLAIRGNTLSGVYEYQNQDQIIEEISSLKWKINTVRAQHNILKDYIKKNKAIKNRGASSIRSLELEFNKFFPKKMLNKESWVYWDHRIKTASFKHSVLQEGQSRYLKASPHAARVFFKAYFRHKKKTIIEALVNEWAMAIEFSRNSDFDEGVRALLIDKDQQPKWQQPIAELKRFFNSKEKNLLKERFLQTKRAKNRMDLKI